MSDYYKNQLEKIGFSKDFTPVLKVVSQTGENETKWLTLNLESIPEIEKFLKDLSEKLRSQNESR